MLIVNRSEISIILFSPAILLLQRKEKIEETQLSNNDDIIDTRTKYGNWKAISGTPETPANRDGKCRSQLHKQVLQSDMNRIYNDHL